MDEDGIRGMLDDCLLEKSLAYSDLDSLNERENPFPRLQTNPLEESQEEQWLVEIESPLFLTPIAELNPQRRTNM